MDCFDVFSLCRTLPPAWSQALVVVTTSHQCYGNCTGCQFVSESCSRSRGLYTSRSLELLPRTLLTIVVFCLMLIVARCGLIRTTCGSWLCRELTINLVTGVSQQSVLDCGTIFHLDYGGWDSPSIL